MAAILSVLESGRPIGLLVKGYLSKVLPGLNRRTLSEVANPPPLTGSLAEASYLGWPNAYYPCNQSFGP